MIRRSILWRVGVALYALINIGGAGYAAAVGEQLHAAVHVVLLLLGATGYLWWRLASRAPREDRSLTPQGDGRLEYLQQSVDAIALEVERIGEAQRFNEKLRAHQGETAPLKQNQ